MLRGCIGSRLSSTKGLVPRPGSSRKSWGTRWPMPARLRRRARVSQSSRFGHCRRNVGAQSTRIYATLDQRPCRTRADTLAHVAWTTGHDHAPHRATGPALTFLAPVLLRLRGLKFQSRDESQISAVDLTRIDLCWSAVAGLSMLEPIRGADFQTRGLLWRLRPVNPGASRRAWPWRRPIVLQSALLPPASPDF